MNKFQSLLMPALLLLSLSACTGSDHRLSAVSDVDLARINKETASRRAPMQTYNRSDAEYRTLVTRSSNRLLRKAQPLCDYTDYKSCFFQITYSPKDTVNAYAHDGYKITVFRGLLQHLQSEDEIAAVIAHEMGHHLANHNQEKMQNAMIGAAVTGILTAVVLSAASNNTAYSAQQQRQNQQTIQNMTNVGATVGALSYSVEEEREADLLGQYLLARAGYSLQKAERVVWLLMNIKASSGSTQERSAFGDSHPAGPERIAAWRNVVAEIKSNPSKLPYKATNQNTGLIAQTQKKTLSGKKPTANAFSD